MTDARQTTQSFPDPHGTKDLIWDGEKFIAGSDSGVLSYPFEQNNLGWTDELTDFHEEVSSGQHPIDLASLRLAVSAVKTHVPTGGKVLEIGCSGGHLLRKLRRDFPDLLVAGSDIIDAPLRKLASRLRADGIPTPILRFDLTKCPLTANSFDAVVALNVLEHIEDHEKAFAEIHRLLKPGGAAILEVPAGSRLYDNYDRELRHFRRYDQAELLRLGKISGLEAVRVNHLGFFIYPPFWVIKRWRSGKMAKTDKKNAGVSDISRSLISLTNTFLMKSVFSLELFLGKYLQYPCGIRCVGIFKKPA